MRAPVGEPKQNKKHHRVHLYKQNIDTQNNTNLLEVMHSSINSGTKKNQSSSGKLVLIVPAPGHRVRAVDAASPSESNRHGDNRDAESKTIRMNKQQLFLQSGPLSPREYCPGTSAHLQRLSQLSLRPPPLEALQRLDARTRSQKVLQHVGYVRRRGVQRAHV